MTITVDEFVYDSALGQLCTTDDIVTSAGAGFDDKMVIPSS